MQELQNVLTVLTKHNLLSNHLDRFSNTLYYEFRHTECLLRLSMPRYLSAIGKEAKNEASSLLKFVILKEIFLAGSLSKGEIAEILKRKKSWIRELAESENLEKLVEQVCGELTLDHILAGVSDEQS